MVRHGGLWIFSDAEAEQEIADCVYKISWYTEFGMLDDSFLRRVLARSQFEEELSFVQLLRAIPIGPSVHQEWQEFAARCRCEDDDKPVPDCRMHAVITACQRCCELVDAEWHKIADWYHPDSQPRRPITGSEPLEMLLADQAESRDQRG